MTFYKFGHIHDDELMLYISFNNDYLIHIEMII